MSLLHMGVVVFRVMAKSKDAAGGLRKSFGITIPREAAFELGWHPGQYLEVWVDKERKLLIVREVEIKPPEFGKAS